MLNKLDLYIPKLEELEYRQRIMGQPETMDYNKGYKIAYEGYHADTGCIDFPKSKWEKWYHTWINNKPICYYAYIVRKEDSTFIGEVNFHYNEKKNGYDMGIIIEGKYRGMGYSKEALRLMLDVAFNEYHVNTIHNSFENTRKAAIRTHEDIGFSRLKEEAGIIHLIIHNPKSVTE